MYVKYAEANVILTCYLYCIVVLKVKENMTLLFLVAVKWKNLLLAMMMFEKWQFSSRHLKQMSGNGACFESVAHNSL